MKRLLLFGLGCILLLSAFKSGKKVKIKLPEEFVYVPGGTFSPVTEEEPYWSHTRTDSNRRVTLQSFYMSKFEVTNLQYRQFFNEVSINMTEEEKEKITCDSLGWRTTMTYCEPIVEYYYRHPAYNNYPMVNVSYEGASKYCEWLQQKMQKDNPAFTIEVKLPTKDQWIYAAMGGRSQAMYPWGNYYLRNKKGEFLCNFKRVGDQAIYRNRKTGKPEVAEGSTIAGSLNSSFYTAAVKSFYPNDFGLYNMCGNAAEMITDKGTCMGGSWNDYGGDVQIRATANYEDPEPTIGFRPVVIVKEKEPVK